MSTATLHHVQEAKGGTIARARDPPSSARGKRRACSRGGQAAGENRWPGRARGGPAVGAPVQQQAREAHVYAITSTREGGPWTANAAPRERRQGDDAGRVLHPSLAHLLHGRLPGRLVPGATSIPHCPPIPLLPGYER